MTMMLLFCLATASCVLLSPVTAQSSTGTHFAVALPRTGDAFDGLVRLTAKEEATVTIQTAEETREITVPAESSTTEVFTPDLRVSFGTENKGVIITSDNPVSVQLDQPSWELDVAMARPVDSADTEFYILNYLGDSVTASFFPLGFFTVVASEDDTTVTINDGDDDTVVQLNMFDAYTEDANEVLNGANLDYTGRYITADKPVSVFTGHGRVLFPPNNQNQYIYDSMPNNAQLDTSYTTFPVGFGSDDNGYIIRILAATDGTEVTIPDLGVAETLNAGEYYQETYGTSYNSFKVECSAPCSVLQVTVASIINSGGDYDTTSGGSMVPLTPDNAYSTDLLVTTPFENDPDNNYILLAIVVNTFPVTDVLVNGENVNDISTWYAGTNDEYAFASVLIEEENAIVRITTDNANEAFAAYIISNLDQGLSTKAYSAGYGQ